MEGSRDAEAGPPREGATITPYRNGPYLLRGDFTIVDQEGGEIRRERGTIALCRCGRSGSKPFCDGTHKLIGFEAGSAADPRRPTSEPEVADGD